MSNGDDHDELIKLKAESRLQHEQVMVAFSSFTERMDTHFRDFREMHKDHYVKAETHGKEIVQVQTDFKNLKEDVHHHIAGHWKWVGYVAAALGALEVLFKWGKKIGE